VLSAGRDWAIRTLAGCLVRALPVVAWTDCAESCLSLVGPRICWPVGGTRDIPIEALFPQGRKHFKLGSSGWPRVLRIDAVGGPPHCNVADKSGARVTYRCSPDRPGVTLAGLIVNLVGEVGDLLGSLCQVVAPEGMGMQR
jgi:hypothetical protein